MVLSATESITRVTVEEEEMALVTSSPASLGSALGKGSRFGRVLAWSFAVLFLGLAVWFGWQRWLDKTGGSPVDVVLAQMTGRTGDPVLDQALVAALRMDLSQSPFVSLVAPATVRATLTEMNQNPDAPMSSAVARDACERTNSHAVLQGNVARAGQHFLLTEEATSCVNGAVPAEAKQEAFATEDLPHSIDRLAESLRRKLGEARRSIARFEVPLFVGETVSLEALKDFSQAAVQADQGKFLVVSSDLCKRSC